MWTYLVGASADADSAPPIEWVVQIHKHRSLKDKILGRSKMQSDDPLSGAIERLVRGERRIEQVEVTRDA